MATYRKDADLTGLFVVSPAVDRRTKNLAVTPVSSDLPKCLKICLSSSFNLKTFIHFNIFERFGMIEIGSNSPHIDFRHP